MLNSTCRTIADCVFSQFVNFNALTFLTALVFSTYQIIWTILTNFLIGLFKRVLWEYKICWQHFCSLWKLYVLKTERNARGIWRIIYYKKNKESLKKQGETFDYVSCFPLHFFRALASSRVLYNTTEQNTVKAFLFVTRSRWLDISLVPFFFFLRFYGPQNEFSQYPCTAFITHPYTRTALSVQCSSNLVNKPTGSCWLW